MDHLAHLMILLEILLLVCLVVVGGCASSSSVLTSTILNGQVQLLMIVLRKLFNKVNGVNVAGIYGDVLVAVVPLGRSLLRTVIVKLELLGKMVLLFVVGVR